MMDFQVARRHAGPRGSRARSWRPPPKLDRLRDVAAGCTALARDTALGRPGPARRGCKPGSNRLAGSETRIVSASGCALYPAPARLGLGSSLWWVTAGCVMLHCGDWDQPEDDGDEAAAPRRGRATTPASSGWYNDQGGAEGRRSAAGRRRGGGRPWPGDVWRLPADDGHEFKGMNSYLNL